MHDDDAPLFLDFDSLAPVAFPRMQRVPTAILVVPERRGWLVELSDGAGLVEVLVPGPHGCTRLEHVDLALRDLHLARTTGWHTTGVAWAFRAEVASLA